MATTTGRFKNPVASAQTLRCPRTTATFAALSANLRHRTTSFDYLIGAGQHRRRHVDAERPGRAAAFMVPGALGILEGSSILFSAVLGLPAQTALTIALARRVRELALGLRGLFIWQWLEGHHLFRHARDPGQAEAFLSQLS